MPNCTECGGTTIEYDAAAGNGFCTDCGTVIEENTIVSEITFGETSSGAAIVQGAFVGQGATTAKLSNPFSRHNNSLGSSGATSESREMTIANATKKIQSIANLMRLPNTVVLSATRLYTLAVEHKFTKGRKSMNVVAVCLYVACRQKEAGTRCWMLIDFSDLLQVNVFELGHCYLNLIQALHLRLPLVDPSHYISRFASLLEFGDDTHRVAQDAVRVVARFDRDWMTRGRRPAGICGAALLLAARMNGFNRSMEEVVQIVKIADTTLKKRLEEFKNTPSGKLSIADFRNVWLDEECDPPAYTKNRDVEQADGEEEDEESEGDVSSKKKAKKRKTKLKDKDRDKDKHSKGHKVRGKKRKRRESDMSGDEVRDNSSDEKPGFDPELFQQGILAGVLDLDPTHEFVPPTAPGSLSRPADNASHGEQSSLTNGAVPCEMVEETLANIDPQLRLTEKPTEMPASQEQDTSLTRMLDTAEEAHPIPPDELEASLDSVLTEDIAQVLASSQGAQISEVLEAKEQHRLESMKRRREDALVVAAAEVPQNEDSGSQDNIAFSLGATHSSGPDVDYLLDLDEEELDWFILSEEEVRIKERVWVEMNRDYLEALALKGEQTSDPKKGRKRRKTMKPRDASNASGSTAAESVQKMMKKNPKYSKRINYDALKDLLDASADAARIPTPFPGLPSLEDKDDGDLYFMTPEPFAPSAAIRPDTDAEKDAEIVVIQEGEGTVVLTSPRPVAGESVPGAAPEPEEDNDDEDEEIVVDDRAEEGWEDEWEQEL